MALINAGNYSQLSKMAVVNDQRKPGKFFNVSISGKRRGQINAGYYQCSKSFDSDKHYILNESEVYFAPLYIKRYWVKYKRAQIANGNEFDVPCMFGWEDGSKKPDSSCKYEYIVAGILWDSEKKDYKKHDEDYEEAGIKAGDYLLVYFRCKGTRCSCGYDLLNRIQEAAKNLEPLSDDPTFETNVIAPRRFLIKASIDNKSFDFSVNGRQQSSSVDVYKFEPITKFNTNRVEFLLDYANKMLKDFNEQFDKTEQVAQSQQTPSAASDEQVEDTPQTNKEAEVTFDEGTTPADNFNLDIGL